MTAITYLERKWAAGYSNNLLHETATQTPERKAIPFLDYDTQRNVSHVGRRVMLSLGRWLFANFSTVRGALLEQAEFASSSYIPQYCGDNDAWGDLAEQWMEQHDQIIDVAGRPFDMRIYRRNLILSVLRDGDMATILVKGPGGYPQIQCIPSHRIGNRMNHFVVTDAGSPYLGRRIIDGVIVDDQGAPLAYRIMSENPWDYSTFVDVAAENIFLTFIPEYVDQRRGFSALASSLFDWQDVSEFRRFELLAQKIGASISLLETNELGQPEPGSTFIGQPATTPATPTATGLVTEMLDGGEVRYLRSTDPNAKLESFKNDRPSGNQQAFEDKIVRSAFHGMGWSVDFSLDPSKQGGATMRIIIEKINRLICGRQDLILEPACRRIDSFRLAQAIEIGLLPFDKQWTKWTYHGPARFSADAKYESDLAINEHRAGHRTLKKIAADNSEYWEDLQDQLIAERKRLEEKCAAAGVDPNTIVWPSTTGEGQQQKEEGGDNSEGAKEGSSANAQMPNARTPNAKHIALERNEAGEMVGAFEVSMTVPPPPAPPPARPRSRRIVLERNAAGEVVGATVKEEEAKV